MKLKEKVEFLVIENATVLPCKKDYKPKSWGVGGVIDQNDKFVHSSGLYMNWISFGGKYDHIETELNYENKDVIWFGFFYKHWGHFLLDFISRMWYVLEHYNGEEIVYISHDKTIDSNYIQFFKLLGVDESKVRRVTSPTCFNKVIIPEYSRTEAYCNEKYLTLFEYISNKVLENTSLENKNKFTGKSLYLSRSKFSDANKKEIGENQIEDCFNNAGFESISPESLTLPEQILMWNLASKIACINGTLPLNFLFGSNALHLIVLNKTNLTHKNLDDVLKIKNHSNVKFIDVYEPYFSWASKNIGDGPFVLKVTSPLREYLDIRNARQNNFFFYIKATVFVFTFKFKSSAMKLLKSYVKKLLNLNTIFSKKTPNHE